MKINHFRQNSSKKCFLSPPPCLHRQLRLSWTVYCFYSIPDCSYENEKCEIMLPLYKYYINCFLIFLSKSKESRVTFLQQLYVNIKICVYNYRRNEQFVFEGIHPPKFEVRSPRFSCGFTNVFILRLCAILSLGPSGKF